MDEQTPERTPADHYAELERMWKAKLAELEQAVEWRRKTIIGTGRYVQALMAVSKVEDQVNALAYALDALKLVPQ